MAAAAILDNFEWPYSEHRAVIFAIAQLSCYNISMQAEKDRDSDKQ